MRKAEDILQVFLDRIGRSDGKPYVGLFRNWHAIAGERIAAHTEPVDVRGTALVVEADHPGWVQMVLFSRERILRELKRRYPELTITGLHVRVSGAKPAPGAPARTTTARPTAGSVPPAPPTPSRDEAEALEQIEDDDLRNSLERLRESLDPDGK